MKDKELKFEQTEASHTLRLRCVSCILMYYFKPTQTVCFVYYTSDTPSLFQKKKIGGGWK
jgi:hypothetical protein